MAKNNRYILLFIISFMLCTRDVIAISVKNVDWCSDIVNNSSYASLNIEEITSDNLELLYSTTFLNDYSYQ